MPPTLTPSLSQVPRRVPLHLFPQDDLRPGQPRSGGPQRNNQRRSRLIDSSRPSIPHILCYSPLLPPRPSPSLAMSTQPQATLASLLSSSSFLLAYTLPLFLLSLLLTFAGAFLTLDRTRAFAPRYDALQPPEATRIQHAEVLLKKIFRLEGGIGGIALGFVFGGMLRLLVQSALRLMAAQSI